MFSGDAQLRHVDNDRYGPERWTTVRDVLATRTGATSGSPGSTSA
jgi:hypothetical protein